MGALADRRLCEATSGSGRLRVLLLTLGAAAGMAAVSASLTIGHSAHTLFDDLDRAVSEPDRIEIEPAGGRLAPTMLDSLQAYVPTARLCPVMEGAGRFSGEVAGEIRVLGLDFLGDPRLELVNGWLGPNALRRLVVPTVFLPEHMFRASRASVGRAVDVTVEGRSMMFVVAPTPLPDDVLGRSVEAVVVVDIAHFQTAFRPEGGIDRIAVVAEGEAATRAAEAAIVAQLPAGARILALGDGSELAGAWMSMWRRAASLLVSAGFLLGVVIVYLSATAAYARLRPVTRRLGTTPRERGMVVASEILEVVAVSIVAGSFGAFNGWLLTDALAERLLAHAVWETAAPVVGHPQAALIGLAWAMGLALPTAFAVLARMDVRPGEEVLIDVPKAPAAAAGVLLVVASLLSAPGLGEHSLAMGYAAGLFVCIAIGLLGRPFFAYAGAALKRRASSRWPIGARVIAAQLIECPTTLGVSLAFVAFTLASTTALWNVSLHLDAQSTAWLERAFAPDVRIETPSIDAQRRTLLPAAVMGALRTTEAVSSAAVVRDVEATLAGTILPLTFVSPERLARLHLTHGTAVPVPGAGAADAGALPLYVPDVLAARHGLGVGMRTWIDTETGSWPCVVAATFRPGVAEAPRCLADASESLSRLARDAGAGAIDIRLTAGVTPHEGREAIGAAIGPGTTIRLRPLGAARPLIERAFATARRAVGLLVCVLALLAGTAFLAFAGGALVDIPPGWRVMVALGVSRSRVARAGALGLTALGLVGLAAGAVAGALAACAVVGAVLEPWVGGLRSVYVAPLLLGSAIVAWLILSALVKAAMRSDAFARAIEGGVE